jgi:hypothetical protein
MPLKEFHSYAIILLTSGVILAGHFLLIRQQNIIFPYHLNPIISRFNLYLFFTTVLSNYVFPTATLGMSGLAFGHVTMCNRVLIQHPMICSPISPTTCDCGACNYSFLFVCFVGGGGAQIVFPIWLVLRNFCP